MEAKITDKKLLAAALNVQTKEITEYHIYTRLAKLCKDAHNSEVLQNIGKAEQSHALYWQQITGIEVKPKKFRIFWSVLKARVLGLTFTLKQMEKAEGTASHNYMELIKEFPEAGNIANEESEHEKKLLNMLDEESLHYVGSVVLGLNDALVELTGCLAGFTLALESSRIISLAGLVTGISASLSMASAKYLSSKAEEDPRAIKSAVYTGVAYLITVALLILPFLLLPQKFLALGITILLAVLIILVFNFYLAVAKDLNFKQRFLEMAVISLLVAAISFGVGYVLNKFLGA